MKRKPAILCFIAVVVIICLLCGICHYDGSYEATWQKVFPWLQRNYEQCDVENAVDASEKSVIAIQTNDNNDDVADENIDNYFELYQYNLFVRTQQEYLRLLSLLEKYGITQKNTIPSINAVTVTAGPVLIEMLRQDIPSITYEYDVPVSLPVERAETGMRPVGKNLLECLGIDKKQQDRGKNVKIAIIDEPISFTESTEKANIQQLDLFDIAETYEGTHGNSIASILVSNADYLQGIVPSANILSVPIVNSNGQGSAFNLATAIVAAADNGAQIISISLCGDAPSNVLKEAVDYATSKGAIIVAAAGNDGENKAVYPAAYENVLSVSACDAEGNITSFSNASDTVNICAPGVGIAVDDQSDSSSLKLFSGTSAAVPCVVGTLANLLSEDAIQSQDARQAILDTAIDQGRPYKDNDYGAGVLNYLGARNYNNKSYTDVAAAGHYFDMENADGDYVPLLVSAQNTGNTILRSLKLNYTVNETVQSAQFKDVMPNETVTTTVLVPVTDANTVKVSSSVETDIDDTPTNNSKTATYNIDK